MSLNKLLPREITMHTLQSARHDEYVISFEPRQFVGLFLDPSPDWGATLRVDHDGRVEEYTISDDDAFRLMWVYAILKAKFTEALSVDEKRRLVPRRQETGS